jgi:hypothetical protein
MDAKIYIGLWRPHAVGVHLKGFGAGPSVGLFPVEGTGKSYRVAFATGSTNLLSLLNEVSFALDGHDLNGNYF